MRFGEHFCAAGFYKQGNSRGNWVEIVLEFCFGAVGFLVNGAQRARRTKNWQANAIACQSLAAGGVLGGA
jgi:hypothetical protein